MLKKYNYVRDEQYNIGKLLKCQRLISAKVLVAIPYIRPIFHTHLLHLVSLNLNAK